jgi:hypothetical protein
MKTRIEIEQADNGYTMRVWKDEEKEEQKDDYGYHEPKTLVATEIEEVYKCVKETFK